MAPHTKKKVQIWYGVLSDGSVFSVKIARHAMVTNLRAAIFKQERFQVWFSFQASAIRLYMLQDPHVGLTGDSNLDFFLTQGQVPERGFKEMDALCRLDDDECFGSTFPTREEELRVLNADGDFSPLPLSDVDRFLTLPHRYMEGSGLATPTSNGPIVLYRRDALQDQWDEIQRCVIDCHAQLYIVGAPGAGKSCAAYAFACCRVDRARWVVVWINASHTVGEYLIVVLDDNRKATARIADSVEIPTMLEQLRCTRADKTMLVFLDGSVETQALMISAEDKLLRWCAEDVNKRRFVCVASNGALDQWNHSHRGRVISPATVRVPIRQRMVFDVVSWTLDEYMEAIKDPRFVETVKSCRLVQHDGASAPEDTPVVELKAVQTLDEAINSFTEGAFTDATPLSASKTLIGLHRQTARAIFTEHIVSLYATRELATRIESDRFQGVVNRFGFNTASGGWLLENWFFYALVSSGVWFYECNAGTRKEDKDVRRWHSESVVYFDPTSDRCPLQVGWNAPEENSRPNEDHHSVLFSSFLTVPFLPLRSEGKERNASPTGKETRANSRAMAPRKKKTVEIWCGVLKDGSVFSVRIANDATVANLCAAIFKQERFEDRFSFQASAIKLFMPEDAQAGHSKLVASSDLIPFLEDGQVPESGFKELVPLWKLNSPNCFGPEFPTTEGYIHVLVKVPGEGPDSKRQRTDEVVWNVADGEYAATDVVTMTLHTPAPGVTNNWIVVPNRFLGGSGVYPPTLHEDLVLYQRRVFQDQWTMMQTCAMDAGAVLYVVGAPGTGKSSAAFSFACSQVDRTLWIVVWIHYDPPVERFRIIKFDGDKKATAEVKDAEDITAMLHALETPRRGFVVFFNGYVHSKDASRNAHMKLVQWLCDNRHSRRLIYVSSMTVLAKDYKEDTEPTLEAPASWPPMLLTRTSPRQCLRTMKFDVTSWNLDEYIDAVRNDRFYNSVNAQLGASAEARGAQATQLATRAHHVMIKYELAGGSARYMFSKDPGFVVESVTGALRAVPNKRVLMDLLDGGASQQTINRLLAHYIRKGVFETELVSLYVARRIANEIGAAMISSYQKLLTVNPALDGHLLEGWFFLSLASSGLTYCDRDTMKEKEWMASVPHFFDPYSQPFYLHPGWNVPVKWNQAGYDAVYWEIKPAAEGKAERRRLVFVQMTRASKHKYDPGPFLQIANRLNEREQYASRAQTQREIESTAPLVDRIDLYFVVPLANLATFQVPVAATDFDRRVIQAAVTLGGVDCKVRVVGVDYRMHGSSSDGAPGGRVVRRPAALNAQEYAFNHAVHTARTQLAAASSSQEDDDSG